MNLGRILKFLNLLMPFCYIIVGGLLLTNLFSSITRERRVLFAVIVIVYGSFRIYKTFMMNKRDGE